MHFDAPTPAHPAPGARHPSRTRAAVRAAGTLPTLSALALLAACGGRDPFAPDPARNLDTQQADLTVYPLAAAAGPLGSAVDLGVLRVVRPAVAVGGGGALPNSDFAVVRAADGRVRLLPSKLVVTTSTTGRAPRTGFQRAAAPFDSVADAPAGGYESDSATTVAPGQTVVVESESLVCAGRFQSTLYAKLVVLSVDAATGAVALRARVNPNCGFRSLRVGRG